MTGKKKWIAIAGLFVVTFVLMFFYARQMRQNRMQKDIAKEILRLHVVANSDSKKDQALKMEVKEAVVTYLRGVMQDAESVDEARIQIQKRLPEIEAVAKEKMQQKGYSYDADATLSTCYFPVKTYGDMIFPATQNLWQTAISHGQIQKSLRNMSVCPAQDLSQKVRSAKS